MSHLNSDEVRCCMDSMFISLYGKDLQARWKHLKQQAKFVSEKEFVMWILDLVEDSLLEQDDDVLVCSMGPDQNPGGSMVNNWTVKLEGLTNGNESKDVMNDRSEVSCPEPPMSPCSVIPEDVDIKDDDETYGIDELDEDTTFYSDDNSVHLPNDKIDDDGGKNSDNSDQQNTTGGQHTPKSFDCNLCSASFKRRFDLNLHESTVHFDGKQYPCSKCPHVFNSRSDRIHHLQIVHEMQMYVCDKCDKVFANRTYLSHHKLNIHERCRVFRCTLRPCAKSFSSASNLRRHEKTAHFGVRFKCVECESLFSSKQKLLYHKKRCSPTLLNNDDESNTEHING